MERHVTIGVPVYHGEDFLEETLRSIQNQTHEDFDVLISIDGPDSNCEEICAPFLNDSRFKLFVQPDRLGWVGNINWLMSQASGDYWYFHQQDDLTAQNYLEVLIGYAVEHPSAALVFCDVVPFGRIQGDFYQSPSVLGATPYMRQMTLLHEHFPAFAFRGLTASEALRKAGRIPTNDYDNFAVDMTWLAGVALHGELHRVPMKLYRKRYHFRNTELRWWSWRTETRLPAWSCHCVDMLEQALRVNGTAQEMRLLWLAAVERLSSPQAAGYFFRVEELKDVELNLLFDSFFERARASTIHNIPVLLDAHWNEIYQWSKGFYWVPKPTPMEIIEFGPDRVNRCESYNAQPDGNSAIWVRTSRRPVPGSRIQLGKTVLDTHLSGTLLTALIPASVTQQPGKIELIVVDLDGTPRSQPVIFEVLDPGM